MPATVNGKAVNWLLDTAFSQPAMSESEARSLGIAVSGATAAATDFAGGTAALRMSVAQRMTIGGVELRNVPVIVFPDSQPPFSEHPPGRRGAIGLPVALALERIRWTNDGRCEVGSAPGRAPAGDGNLAFDGETPVVRTRFSGRPVDFVLDTGNQGGTQLWKRFADDFPDVVKAGRPATKQVHQIGGATDQQIVEIPELHFQIAAFDGVLRPANVFAAPIGNDFQHGNLGMDVLGQAREVILDFRAMSLAIR
jgi:hypothetical protein